MTIPSFIAARGGIASIPAMTSGAGCCAAAFSCHVAGMTDQTEPTGDAPPATSPPAQGNAAVSRAEVATPTPDIKEVGGPKGPEPTRYGDWQYKGRVTDF
jgi:hypothetical protein